jgi:hypothetical protein
MEAIMNESQRIGEFVDWLQEKGIYLCEYRSYTDSSIVELDRTRKNIQDLLAEFFGIDLDKIEAEKRAMLDEIRKANEVAKV